MRTLLDLRGSILTVIIITHGRIHDVNIFDQLITEAGAMYIMDCGYLDFARLFMIRQPLGFFVIRAKRNFSNLFVNTKKRLVFLTKYFTLPAKTMRYSQKLCLRYWVVYPMGDC